jgi:hypothetical protein
LAHALLRETSREFALIVRAQLLAECWRGAPRDLPKNSLLRVREPTREFHSVADEELDSRAFRTHSTNAVVFRPKTSCCFA